MRLGRPLKNQPLELVDGVDVGLSARDQYILVDAVTDHAPSLVLDRHRHFALRIEAGGDRVYLVADQLASGLRQLRDAPKDRVHRSHAERHGLAPLAFDDQLDGRARGLDRPADDRKICELKALLAGDE